MAADPCVNGRWDNGICVCNTGYEIGFSDDVLYPRYCERQIVTVIQRNEYVTNEEIVQYIAVMMTVCLAVWSVLSIFTLIYSVIEKLKWHKTIRQAEGELQMFHDKEKRYENHEMLDATIWSPPDTFTCIT